MTKFDAAATQPLHENHGEKRKYFRMNFSSEKKLRRAFVSGKYFERSLKKKREKFSCEFSHSLVFL